MPHTMYEMNKVTNIWWVNTSETNENIPVGCVLPALHHTRGLCLGVSLTETPWTDTPWIPLDGDPPLDREPPPPSKEHGTRQPYRKWHHTESPHEQNDWHKLLKILPCPKLRHNFQPGVHRYTYLLGKICIARSLSIILNCFCRHLTYCRSLLALLDMVMSRNGSVKILISCPFEPFYYVYWIRFFFLICIVFKVHIFTNIVMIVLFCIVKFGTIQVYMSGFVYNCAQIYDGSHAGCNPG